MFILFQLSPNTKCLLTKEEVANLANIALDHFTKSLTNPDKRHTFRNILDENNINEMVKTCNKIRLGQGFSEQSIDEGWTENEDIIGKV